VTRASGREDAAVPRTRDQQATRAKNHRRVDAIVAVTGLPRKAALRLLRRAPRPRPSPGPGGRPREYGPEIAAAAAVRWPACGRIGAHRLPPSCPSSSSGSPSGAHWPSPPTSTSACARPAAPRSPGGWRPPAPSTRGGGALTPRPGTLLKHAIPIRTFTVGRCPPRLPRGRSGRAWWLPHRRLLPRSPLRGRPRHRLGRAGRRLGQGPGARRRRRRPRPHAPAHPGGRPGPRQRPRIHHPPGAALRPPLRDPLHPQARLEEARPRHVEPKHGAIVRQLVGDDRFPSRAAYAHLQRVPQLARWHVNFFQPVPTLGSQTRTGARPRRFYDRAQTPDPRLGALGVLPPEPRADLEALSPRLNPLPLRRDLVLEAPRRWLR